MSEKFINLLGVIVTTFLLGLYFAKQFKYNESVSLFDWSAVTAFWVFMILRVLSHGDKPNDHPHT